MPELGSLLGMTAQQRWFFDAFGYLHLGTTGPRI
jgi:hypothetical protein